MAQMVGFPGSPAAHAQSDLADTKMGDFEASANPNAGLNPQRNASASATPDQVGKWSGIKNVPLVPVFAALLPDGRVLFWDSAGGTAPEYHDDHTYTRAVVWDRKNSSFKDVYVSGHNIFCSGFAHLPNGDVFVAGGNKNSELDGINKTHIFDYSSDTWYAGPDMAYERWYPSVAARPNGEHVVMGGGPAVPEVTEGDHTSWRSLTSADWGSHRSLYPFVQTAPNGKVLYAGPKKKMALLFTKDTGSWQFFDHRDALYRFYASYAMYRVGKVLVAGGGPEGALPTNSAVVIDWNGATPVSSSTGNMNYGRRQFNLTLLPDGTVLATGGLSSTAGYVDLGAAVYNAESWDPKTGTWTTLAPQAVARQYHSVALLLPDGKVVSAGGGVCDVCQEQGYLRKDMEIFAPPYLFKKDGSGALADRPKITFAPSRVHYGNPFTISTDGKTISNAAFIKLGAVTHGQDMDQRYVPLSFVAQGSGTLLITPPANNKIAPPGHYMLFIIDDAGAPSKAWFVRIRH